MFVETDIGQGDLESMKTGARYADTLGFDGVAHPEVRRDPFISLTLAATLTERVRLATDVALAFPRSPMVVAYIGRDLQEISNGRFLLGLGTQVKGHIERRFSTPWFSPGPRLREYILALRAIWDTWEHDVPLNFQGEFYTLTLMTPEWSPGPSRFGPPKIAIAGVNEYNLRLAGELCDELRVHPLTSPAYLRDVIWPNVERGAARSGRSLADFKLSMAGFVATGATTEEVAAARERIRYRVAFYSSTRTYLPVLRHHGWDGINPTLRELIAENRWSDLPSVVTDEILDAFCMAGTYDEIAEVIGSRVNGLVDIVSLPLPADPEPHRERIRRAVEQLKQLTPASATRQPR